MTFVSGFYSFNLSISNSDSEQYAKLRLKTPRHPQETSEFLYARILAYCHCYRPEQEFSRCLFEPKDPTIWQKDVTGEFLLWVQVGCPSEDKLHKALRRYDNSEFRVYFCSPSEIEMFCHFLRGAKSNWASRVKFFQFDPDLLTSLAELENSSSDLNFTYVDSSMYLNLNGHEINGTLKPVDIWQEFQRSIENQEL